MSNAAEAAGEQVAQTVETIEAAAESAVAAAEARAEAAEAVNEAMTEAALRDRLSSRIDDCEEGISECDEEIQNLEIEQRQLRTSMTEAMEQIRQQMADMSLLIPSKPAPRPSTSTDGREDQASPSETSLTAEQLAAQNLQQAANDAAALPAAAAKERRSRLI